MKSKLDEGGYAGRRSAMNFLTTSQMDMAHKVTNTDKFKHRGPVFSVLRSSLLQGKGHPTLVKAFLQAAGLLPLAGAVEQSETEGGSPCS